MALYEHVFLARQDLAQAQVDQLAEMATKIVEDGQGKVVRPRPGVCVAWPIASRRTARRIM